MNRIGKYSIVSQIGRGGFGRVYKAIDPSMSRSVAIKVLDSVDDEMLARFRNEALAGGNLRHRNITIIYEFGEEKGTPFIVMEYLDGHDLDRLIQSRRPLDTLQKIDILIQAAEGLYCAHQSGVIHRDVKPGNIMVLNDSTVKLMDFGIARLTEGNRSVHTMTGTLIGTVRYMAPEQFEGLEADQRADIWAWGVIGWELFSGRHPFMPGDTPTLMYKITNSVLSETDVQWEGCSPGLVSVIKRAVTRQRNRRYGSFEDVLFDLKPVRRELQRMKASVILAEARAKLGEGQIPEAQRLLRSVLDLDSDHPDLPELRGRLQQVVSRQRSLDEARQLRSKAETAIQERRYEEAVQCLESVQRMAPEMSGIVQLLSTARAGQQRRKLSESLVGEANREFAAQNMSLAFNFASEAAQADPDNHDALRVLANVQEAMRNQQTEREAALGIERAEHLLAIQEYDEAVEVLKGITSSQRLRDIERLLSRAQTEKSASDLQAGIERILDSAREARNNGQPARAVQLLEELCARYPSAYEQAEPLLVECRQQLNAEARQAQVNQALTKSTEFFEKGRFDDAKAVLDAALVQWPGDEDLVRALNWVMQTRAFKERERMILRALEKAESLRKRQRLLEASEYLDRVMQELGGAPELLFLRQLIGSEMTERSKPVAPPPPPPASQPATAAAAPPPVATPAPAPPSPPTNSEAATRMFAGSSITAQPPPPAPAPVEPPPPAPPHVIPEAPRNKPPFAIMGVAAAVLLAAGAWYATRKPEPERTVVVSKLSVPSGPLRFHFNAKAEPTLTLPLPLLSDGNAAVDFRIVGESEGIEPQVRSGKAPAEVNLSVRKDRFAPGRHDGWVEVTNGSQKLRYPVEIVVEAPIAEPEKTETRPEAGPETTPKTPPRIQLSRASVDWKGNPTAPPVSVDFQVFASERQVPYQVTVPAAAAAWLSALPSRGTAPGSVRLALSKWPAPGKYAADVIVALQSPGAAPARFHINLEVTPPTVVPTTSNQQQPPQTQTTTTPVTSVSSNPTTDAAQTQSQPALYGGRTAGRLTWTGSLPPGAAIVVNRDGLVSGPGATSGVGPPSVVPTQIVDVTPPEARYTVSPFESNPAGKIEIRNTGSAPLSYIQIRWRLKP